MADTGPLPRRAFRVLIAGGGVAALEAMLALRALAEERVEIELLAPEPHFWYRPLAVTEPFGLGRAHRFELGELAEAAGARFALGAIASVDPVRRVARTRACAEIEYDALLIALGAVPETAVEGALTFRGPADTEAFRRLLDELESGAVRHLLFAVPGGISWPLPAYELAFLTAAFLDDRNVRGTEIGVVTPEPAPLALFGREAGTALERLLAEHGVGLRTQNYPGRFQSGALRMVPDGDVPADRVVALPKLVGPALAGLPQDASGFVPIDEQSRVAGVDDVYAAGDATTFPIKQGGIAAQQADAAAQAIALAAGAEVELEPFRPVMRGLLLTGEAPQFLRADMAGTGEGTFQMTTDPLWWPPAKVVGRHIGPFIAERVGETESRR